MSAGVTQCSCHLPPSSLGLQGPSGLRLTLRSVAITNYSQSIRCCETWRLLCMFLTVGLVFFCFCFFFSSIGNLASQPAGSGNAGTQSWAQFGSKSEGSSCNLVSRWMEGCRVGLHLHGCGKSTLHIKTSHFIWYSHRNARVCFIPCGCPM